MNSNTSTFSPSPDLDTLQIDQKSWSKTSCEAIQDATEVNSSHDLTKLGMIDDTKPL